MVCKNCQQQMHGACPAWPMLWNPSIQANPTLCDCQHKTGAFINQQPPEKK